jgi:lipopolysaccharide export LptBFGC system permease protein LptF
MHKHFFEAVMLACFSVSWFFSIARSMRSRSTGGKSIWFLWIIFAGYVAGVANKILNGIDWVLWLYLLNGAMVLTDIFLYFRNRHAERH